MIKWLKIVAGTLRSLLRSERQLALESLVLRQQLAVLKHAAPDRALAMLIGGSGCCYRAFGPVGEKAFVSFSPRPSSTGIGKDSDATGVGRAGAMDGQRSIQRSVTW